MEYPLLRSCIFRKEKTKSVGAREGCKWTGDPLGTAPATSITAVPRTSKGARKSGKKAAPAFVRVMIAPC